MIQHELTNGHLWFIHARGTGHKPDHTDALYHMPGGCVARRFALLKAFPDLRDSPRDVACAVVATQPIPGAAEALEMAGQGFTVAQIAHRLGRQKRTVEKMLGVGA